MTAPLRVEEDAEGVRYAVYKPMDPKMGMPLPTRICEVCGIRFYGQNERVVWCELTRCSMTKRREP